MINDPLFRAFVFKSLELDAWGTILQLYCILNQCISVLGVHMYPSLRHGIRL